MNGRWDALSRLIRRQVAAYSAAETDTALLARFLADRDETAFEQVLHRYGAMVYGVCRRALPSAPDAEDAFQATFMALVARVRKVGPIEGVGGWLYRAAAHVAADVRRGQRRRHAREARVARPETAPAANPDDAELLAALDEEIARLPARYRQAVIHYHVMNRPLAEAATALGVSVTAAWKRVHQAEELLRKRLARRGLAVPAAGLIGVLALDRGAAAAPPEALRAVLRSVTGGPAPPTPGAAAPAVHPHSPYWLLGVTAVGLLAGAAIWSATRPGDPPAPQPASRPVAALPAPRLPDPPPPWAVLTGRVVDAGGQAVPHAHVAILGRTWDQRGPGLRDELLAKGTAGADGRFRLPVASAPRGDGEAVWLVTSASARGHTVTPVPVVGGVAPADLTVRLAAAGLTGRVVGPGGEPLPGARVRVTRFGGAAFEPTRPEHRPLPTEVWPEPVVAGPDGRFAFPALDPAAGVRLSAVHPPTGMAASADVPRDRTEVEVQLDAARQLAGRVTTADTGRPLPNATVIVDYHPDDPAAPPRVVSTKTGPDGRFAVAVPTAPRWKLKVGAGEAGPHLPVFQWVEPAADADPIEVAVALPRGVVVRGRVADAGSGRPVPLAKVRFFPRTPVTPHTDPAQGAWVATGTTAMTGADPEGRFTLAVPPVPGVLAVTAPGADYLTVEVDPELAGGKPVAAHAVAPLVAPDSSTDLSIRLEKGRTIHGRAELADGTPVGEGWVWCYHLVGGRGLQDVRPLPVQNGRFAVPGCRPGRVYTLVLADRAARRGVVARVEWSDKPAAVVLRPVGEAVVDVRTASDGPAAGAVFSVDLALPPDAAPGTDEPGGVRWHRALADRPAGPDGRVTLGGLVPGARYRVVAGPARGAGVTVVTVPSGGRRSATVVLPSPEGD